MSSGQIDAVVRSLLTERRLEVSKKTKLDMNEVLQWVCKVTKQTPDGAEVWRNWTLKTPGRVKKEEKPPADKKGKKK